MKQLVKMSTVGALMVFLALGLVAGEGADAADGGV